MVEPKKRWYGIPAYFALIIVAFALYVLSSGPARTIIIRKHYGKSRWTDSDGRVWIKKWSRTHDDWWTAAYAPLLRIEELANDSDFDWAFLHRYWNLYPIPRVNDTP